MIQINPDFIFDGMRCRFIAMASSLTVYIVVSLISRRITGEPVFDMDKMLHRGKYAIAEDSAVVTESPKRSWKWLGMGKEFTLGDKLIYLLNYIWIFGWLAVFVIGTMYNLTHDVKTESWLKFWHIYIVVTFFMSILVLIWFLIGGTKDLIHLFRDLRLRKRDHLDDGRVIDHHNIGQ